MRITFILPPLNLSGGSRVVAVYAELLGRRGHAVTVVSPQEPTKRNWLGWSAVSKGAHPVRAASHFDGTSVNSIVLRKTRPVLASDVPPGDCVIATWWETAEWVNRFSTKTGVKMYFVQHHEVFPFLPQRRTRATYRMPLRKIVVANWLADVMRDDYGDSDVDVVPNSVDHSQFHAQMRGKQHYPTVGVLYSQTDWKRFGLALKVLTDLKAKLPALRVLSFGAEQPSVALPSFITFSHRPPQNALRGIYASCDVWLTASSTEGFNLPAMEAMACRTPVVATRTGWPAEAVIDGVNGACVDVDDGEALERETARILAMPDPEWRLLSANAFETVRESSWSHSADLFEQALQREVLRQRGT